MSHVFGKIIHIILRYYVTGKILLK